MCLQHPRTCFRDLYTRPRYPPALARRMSAPSMPTCTRTAAHTLDMHAHTPLNTHAECLDLATLPRLERETSGDLFCSLSPVRYLPRLHTSLSKLQTKKSSSYTLTLSPERQVGGDIQVCHSTSEYFAFADGFWRHSCSSHACRNTLVLMLSTHMHTPLTTHTRTHTRHVTHTLGPRQSCTHPRPISGFLSVQWIFYELLYSSNNKATHTCVGTH
jgi:hypothetical protein